MEDCKQQSVIVSAGAGVEPVLVPWENGLTVMAALAIAEVELDEGETATLGRCRVADPEVTVLQPDDIIVVAGMPSNG